jgi:5-(carboxyamino)imidazole ribonucleotide synthase
MEHGTLPRLGILGGGQLARMTIEAALPLGIDVVVLAEAPDSPAGRLARHALVGAWSDAALQREIAGRVDVVTLENEFVDAGALDQIAALGVAVRPGGAVLRAIQDKLHQKQLLQDNGLAVPEFARVDSAADAVACAERFGWPLILKARRNGYDGYGNATLRSADDIPAAFQRLGWPERELFAERRVPFEHELAVLVARDADGQTVTYPVVETIQQNHICHVVRAPATVDAAIAAEAERLARAADEVVGGIGITAVELFVTAAGQVLINELAPRPHNSGHFSIEACSTSQFENHLRAVLGFPLGPATLRAPSAVMVNLLGTRNAPVEPHGLVQAFALPDVHVHLYGKADSRIGRKLGHVTALGADAAETELRARTAAGLISL